jgi:hypothetical protein
MKIIFLPDNNMRDIYSESLELMKHFLNVRIGQLAHRYLDYPKNALGKNQPTEKETFWGIKIHKK